MGRAGIPGILRVSPVSLVCPHCKAQPGKDCARTTGQVAVVHLERIKAAAAMNAANKRKREELG